MLPTDDELRGLPEWEDLNRASVNNAEHFADYTLRCLNPRRRSVELSAEDVEALAKMNGAVLAYGRAAWLAGAEAALEEADYRLTGPADPGTWLAGYERFEALRAEIRAARQGAGVPAAYSDLTGSEGHP